MFGSIRLSCHKGYKRFYRRTLLETSDYLKDDCLKINCTVGVVVSAVDSPRLQHSIRVPELDIGSHFGMLLDNMEGSDVVFNVLVLAARSPVFRSEFFNPDGEKHHEIDLTDMEPKVFKAVSTCITAGVHQVAMMMRSTRLPRPSLYT
ncbi:hypothetical protein R6Q59_006680 [Mikania micrantha]